MTENKFLKTKSNLAWISVVVIFIGAIIYVPLLGVSENKKQIVYQRIPVPVYVSIKPSNYEQVSDVDKNQNEKENIPEVQKPFITKELKLGDIDPEVKILQKYLNDKGFLVAESGPGSPGQETDRFGAGTKDALIRFQEANREILLKPFGLERGTGFVGELTRNLINS